MRELAVEIETSKYSIPFPYKAGQTSWFTRLYKKIVDFINNYLSEEMKNNIKALVRDHLKDYLQTFISIYFPEYQRVINWVIDNYLGESELDLWFSSFLTLIH